MMTRKRRRNSPEPSWSPLFFGEDRAPGAGVPHHCLFVIPDSALRGHFRCRNAKTAYIGSMLLNALFSYFETWIRPFEPQADLRPPNGWCRSCGSTSGRRKRPSSPCSCLAASRRPSRRRCSGLWGRIVDILGTVNPAEGWSGILEAHGAELFGMLVLIGVGSLRRLAADVAGGSADHHARFLQSRALAILSACRAAGRCRFSRTTFLAGSSRRSGRAGRRPAISSRL